MKRLLIIIFLSINLYGQASDPEVEWTRNFPFIDSSNYYLSNYLYDDISNTAIDKEGNIYIVSNNSVPPPYYKEFRLTKFSSSGVYLWTVSYRDSVYNYNEACAITVDEEGNIYIAAYAANGVDFYQAKADLIFVKYSSQGVLLWNKRYGTFTPFPNTFIIPTSIQLDKKGDIIIGGNVGEFNFDGEWGVDSVLIIKYSSDGEQLWVAETRPDTVFVWDNAGVELDDSGNIFIAGSYYWYTPGKGHYDYIVIKYKSDGKYLWHSIYDYSDYVEYPRDLTVDSKGNVYITGYYSHPYITASNYVWLTLKYDREGNYKNTLYRETTYGNFYEYGGLIRTDSYDNVYIAGQRYSNGNYFFALDKHDSSGSFLWEKLFNIKFYSSSKLLINPDNTVSISGVDSLFAVHVINLDQNGEIIWGNTFSDFATNLYPSINLSVDQNANQCLSLVKNTGLSNIHLFKLNNSGDLLWKTKTGDYAVHQLKKIKVDAQGNVLAAGQIDNGVDDFDYATIKYDSSGLPLWGKRYQGPSKAEDIPNDIEIDDDGNVYVTGSSKGIGTSYDYATIKYDSTGNEKWIARYNGPAFLSDEAQKIKIDNAGNVYVTGNSLNADGNYDIATVKYNNAGQFQWAKRYNGSSNGFDGVCGLELDSEGNVFIGGTSDSVGALYDYLVIKYNSSGDELWRKRYNGTGNDGDWANAITLDDSDNVYITGWSVGNGTNTDYTTVKYSSSGEKLWDTRWDDPSSSYEEANDIAVDKDGNVYVTGFSPGAGTDNDYTTVKYNSFGQQQWFTTYNSQSNGSDIARHIALDYLGYIYVSGFVNGNNEISTVKYNQEGIQQWEEKYSYGNYQNTPADLIVDNAGNIYVAGYSYSSTESFWSIVKYNQPGFIPLDVEGELNPPSKFILYQNYPNPFNPTTHIGFRLANFSFVTLKVYDILGREVETLLNEEKPAGSYEVEFNALGFSSGVYLYKIQAGDYISVRKMILLR